MAFFAHSSLPWAIPVCVPTVFKPQSPAMSPVFGKAGLLRPYSWPGKPPRTPPPRECPESRATSHRTMSDPIPPNGVADDPASKDDKLTRKPFRFQEWSKSNFPCSLTRYITSHNMKNLAFHSLLRWKDDYTTNSHRRFWFTEVTISELHIVSRNNTNWKQLLLTSVTSCQTCALIATAKQRLPVDVRESKTSVLKLSNNIWTLHPLQGNSVVIIHFLASRYCS